MKQSVLDKWMPAGFAASAILNLVMLTNPTDFVLLVSVVVLLGVISTSVLALVILCIAEEQWRRKERRRVSGWTHRSDC